MIVRTDEPIYIHRKTESGVDEYGNPTYTVEEILVRDALFAFGSSSEPIDVERDPVDAKLTLYLPYGTVIQDGDEFEIRETMWVKDGDPNEWQKLWPGFAPGVALTVRRRDG